MGLTKEQKKAKKEAKMLEKLKAEIELQKSLKRDELRREIAAQALKRDELDKNWRQMMLKIKEPIFRQDVEVMWHSFERVYDKKDHLVNHTLRLIKVADDQFQRTVAGFCDTVDGLINNFLSDMEEMSKENDRKTAQLLKSGEDDVAEIMYNHDKAETQLQLLIYHGHTTADNLAWTTRGENLVKADEDRMKYANIREDLRSFLEDNYNNTWENYKAVLKAYVLNTAENQKQVRKLKRKENIMADIIAQQTKKIVNSDGLLKRLRAELAAYESGTKQAVFRDRRNRHREACQQLKKNMYGGVDTDQKQLGTLVKCSDDALEWLENSCKKGEKILRLAAICRKFETQKEKVLPFGMSKPHSPTQGQMYERQTHPDDELVVSEMTSTCGLTRLWQRMSKAELTRRALYREKLLLEQENDELMVRIQEINDDPFGPDTSKCMCGISDSNKKIHKPCAIEGTLDLKKYKRC